MKIDYEQAYACIAYLVDKSFDTTTSEESRFQAHRASYIFKGYLDMLKQCKNPYFDVRWNEFMGTQSARNCGATSFIIEAIAYLNRSKVDSIIAKM